MTARRASKVHPTFKTRYRVKNWRKYEAALRSRGDFLLCISDEALEAWKPDPETRRGGQRQYSDLAILAALSLRLLLHLPLRQTEGFLASIFRLMDLDLQVPDHTTLSRRNKSVEVPTLQSKSNGPIHLILDSTGLRISGPGDWNSDKYKGSKRRSWRKLHLGVDAKGYIVAHVLTDNTGDDGNTGVDLIQQVDVPVERFTADGMYDRKGSMASWRMRGLRRSGWLFRPEMELLIRTPKADSDPNETSLCARSPSQTGEVGSGSRATGNSRGSRIRLPA